MRKITIKHWELDLFLFYILLIWGHPTHPPRRACNIPLVWFKILTAADDVKIRFRARFIMPLFSLLVTVRAYVCPDKPVFTYFVTFNIHWSNFWPNYLKIKSGLDTLSGVKVGRHYRRYRVPADAISVPADSASEIVKFTISIPRESCTNAKAKYSSSVMPPDPSVHFYHCTLYILY